MRVAIVEDDEMMNEYIKELLLNEGYDVDAFFSGLDFLEMAKKISYNCVIMDLNLKKLSGYYIIKTVRDKPRKYCDSNFLILSSKNDQEDINSGLKVGASDYITKPFDDEEFILRVNSIINLTKSSNIDKIRYKEMIFDFTQNEAYLGKERYKLTKKEKKLLEYMIVNIGLVLTRDKLCYEIWGDEQDVGYKALDVCISRLKFKIPYLADKIVSHWGIGFQLIS